MVNLKKGIGSFSIDLILFVCFSLKSLYLMFEIPRFWYYLLKIVHREDELSFIEGVVHDFLEVFWGSTENTVRFEVLYEAICLKMECLWGSFNKQCDIVGVA